MYERSGGVGSLSSQSPIYHYFYWNISRPGSFLLEDSTLGSFAHLGI